MEVLQVLIRYAVTLITTNEFVITLSVMSESYATAEWLNLVLSIRAFG